MKPTLRAGQVVESIAGRDTGTHYIVVGRVDDRFWAVANGRDRTVARPKRKNAKHLAPLDLHCEALARSLAEGRVPTDAEVQAALEELGFR